MNSPSLGRLPTTIDPRIGESLNGFARRLAHANHLDPGWVLGAGTHAMRPNNATVRRVAHLAGFNEAAIWLMAFGDNTLGSGGFHGLELNRRRHQYCALCVDTVELREWYHPLCFACRRCGHLLTDGLTPQIMLSQNTMQVQNEILAAIAGAGDPTADGASALALRRMNTRYRLAMTVRPDQWPILTRDAALLIDHSLLDPAGAQPVHMGMLRVHPPTTALAAITYWRIAAHHALGMPSDDDGGFAAAQHRTINTVTRLRLQLQVNDDLEPGHYLPLVHYLSALRADLGAKPPATLPRLASGLSDIEFAVYAAHIARRLAGEDQPALVSVT